MIIAKDANMSIPKKTTQQRNNNKNPLAKSVTHKQKEFTHFCLFHLICTKPITIDNSIRLMKNLVPIIF